MIEVCNPATCELLATVPDCDAAEVDCAVAIARASFENKTWCGLDPSKRERILWNIGDLLLQHRDELAKLNGVAFDKAYVANEVAYHKTVNGALENTLIPSASNADFKGLLQTGLKIFQGHQQHAEHVAANVK